MRKTLLVTLDFYPKIGGVANYYFNLCQNLPQDKIVVLTEEQRDKNTTTQEHNNNRESAFNFRIIREQLMARWCWPRWWPMIFKIGRISRKETIERLWAGDIWPTGLAIYLISIFWGRPYIISVHGRDLLLAKKNKLKEFLVKIILKQAKTITVNSQSTGRIAEGFGIGQEQTKVIYPGVGKQEDKNTGRQEYKNKIIEKHNLVGKKILLSIGRLVERKGFDKVIEAMPKIGEKVEDLIYVIAGEGPDRERLEKITRRQEYTRPQRLAASDGGREKTRINVIFIGGVSENEKWAWLDLCDIFIMPARETKDDIEGFGIVYLEAAMAGKPVIAGKSGGASEAVIDGETGILVDPENHEEIAGAIIKLFNNKELARKMGDNGKRRVEGEFDWAILGKEMEEILK
ncbi:glycosyltransferase family 4 protein [Candidatus Kuenenbacteria bacterium]|nr:glycosyltransferase family 4 protein [Candidatus Kuenenbacteria bacterium]